MPEPAASGTKVWAPAYAEAAFCFEQRFESLTRLVAWSGAPAQIRQAFEILVATLPDPVEVLLKVEAGRVEDGEPLWWRFRGVRRRAAFAAAVAANEFFVFSDGAHQLTVKDPAREHYFTLDEHGIFFVYAPTAAQREALEGLGFAPREAPLLHGWPHYHRVSSNPALRDQFIRELGLLRQRA